MAGGPMDESGMVPVPEGKKIRFAIPTVPTGGTNRDVGSLALFLVANWFVNGETVLIDGGVRNHLIIHSFLSLLLMWSPLDPPETSFLVLSIKWEPEKNRVLISYTISIVNVQYVEEAQNLNHFVC